MFYLFLLVVGLGALTVYMTLILNLVPGAAAERLGVLEELPPDLGIWKVDESPSDQPSLEEQGLRRETRMYYQRTPGERLVRQVRYRDLVTNEIVRVEPDKVIKRRRVKRRSSS